jgi:hypothetical protein
MIAARMNQLKQLFALQDSRGAKGALGGDSCSQRKQFFNSVFLRQSEIN